MTTILAERYRLENRVAAGGMGEVWSATDMLLERRVAVKLLHSSLASDPVVAERFRREALLAASLSHPNMAGVYDYVQEDGRPGIVMEFVEGETLAERLARRKRLTVPETVEIASALLAALQTAHAAGIVHRDVKPANVILTPDREVKVTDFGIARAVGDHTLTETGMVIGTAHYLSPEQANGSPATPSSDLYAVGAILYEMLTGVRPFEAETPIAAAMRRLTEEPAPLRTHRRNVPAGLEAVVMRALSRDPSARHASADEMRLALRHSVDPKTPFTAPDGKVMGPEWTQEMPVADTAVRPAVHAGVTEVLPLQAEVAAPPAPAAPGRPRSVGGIVVATLAALIVIALTFALVRLGAGDRTVTVPDFRNKTLAQAETLARSLGLKISTTEAASTRPKGVVLDQSLRARLEVGRGTPIELTISSGVPPKPADVEVPDLRGKDREEAAALLEQVGLHVGRETTEESSEVDPGTVLRSSPPSGQTVAPGSSVDIVIATEPRGRGKKRGD